MIESFKWEKCYIFNVLMMGKLRREISIGIVYFASLCILLLGVKNGLSDRNQFDPTV